MLPFSVEPRTSAFRRLFLAALHNALLVATNTFNAFGVIVAILVVRRVIGYESLAGFGDAATVVVLVTILAFLIIRALVRWGDDLHVPVSGRAKSVLGVTAVLGVVLPALAANASRFGEPGLWMEGRVFESGGGYWVWVAGERVAATAEIGRASCRDRVL